MTRVWNLVSHLKGQTEADGELQKDAEEDTYAYEGGKTWRFKKTGFSRSPKYAFGRGLNNVKTLSVYKNTTQQSNNSTKEYVEQKNNS